MTHYFKLNIDYVSELTEFILAFILHFFNYIIIYYFMNINSSQVHFTLYKS